MTRDDVAGRLTRWAEGFPGARWMSHDEIVATRIQGARFGFCGLNVGQPDAHYVRQVHGARVLEASDVTARESASRPDGDGIFTSDAGRRVCVRTADCLPVLMSAGFGARVVAIHAGWRGLTGGILTEATRVVTRDGFRVDECDVVVGPAIGWEAFEIGPEVAKRFRDTTLGLTLEQVDRCVRPGRGDRWHASLAGAAVMALGNLGFRAERILAMASCTHSDRDVWHSYRREGDGHPMNWSWIERE